MTTSPNHDQAEQLLNQIVQEVIISLRKAVRDRAVALAKFDEGEQRVIILNAGLWVLLDVVGLLVNAGTAPDQLSDAIVEAISTRIPNGSALH